MAQSKEAPGGLAVVRAFINTMDYDDGVETFTSPDALLAWLAEQELATAGDTATEDDVRTAIEVREALRSLALTNDEGGSPPAEAIVALNRASRRAPLLARFGDDGRATLEAGEGGVNAALARLLAIVYRAMQTGEWSRLKACRNDTCRWAFYDNSKNRSRHWCSMEVCGSQVKARAYRRRKKAAVPESS